MMLYLGTAMDTRTCMGERKVGGAKSCVCVCKPMYLREMVRISGS